MACEKTCERYDEDEYFVKFFRVHPYLTYAQADDEINLLKLKIQRQLIEEYGNDSEKYSMERCLYIYNKLIKIQTDNKIFIADTEAEMKQFIKKIKMEMNKNLVHTFQNILDKI